MANYTVETRAILARATLEKRKNTEGQDIPKLFEAFPDEVKKDAAVLTDCIEKCHICCILDLFKAFPDDVKKDAIVCAHCMAKCDAFSIPDLFMSFPDEVKQDASMCDSCIKMCWNEGQIPRLFEAFPDEVKQDAVRCISCARNCDGHMILKLFEAFPDEVKRDVAVCTSCIEKCISHKIHFLFKAFPNEVKKDAAVRADCIKRCANAEIPSLYKIFSDEVKKVAAVYTACIKKCLPERIAELFEAFPDEAKNDAAVRTSCLETCRDISENDYALDLFAAFPDEAKKDPVLRTRLFTECTEYQIPKLFEAFPDEVKKDVAVYTSCIEKCSDFMIVALFKAFPDKVKEEPGVCAECAQKVPFVDIDVLMSMVPESVREFTHVQEAQAKKGGGGSVKQKYDSLLTTIPRLLCGVFGCGGAVEIFVFIIGKFLGQEALEIHWHQELNSTWVFEPLPFCSMPPPQPVFVSGIFNACKIIVFTMMFGYMSRHLHRDQDKRDCSKRWIFVMVAFFQLVIVPITATTSIVSFFTQIYPNMPGFRAGYECFYLRWNSSFFDFSYWFLYVRACGIEAVLSASNTTRGYYCRARKTLLKPWEQIKDLHATLLDKPDETEVDFGRKRNYLCQDERGSDYATMGALEWKKWALTKNAMVVTAGIYIIIDIPFVVTHKIPAGLAFSPIILPLAVLILAAFRITWPDGWHAAVQWVKMIARPYDWYEAEDTPPQQFLVMQCMRKIIGYLFDMVSRYSPRDLGGKYTPKDFDKLEEWEHAERTGFLVFFPILFGMSLLNLIMTYGSVYLYRGLGYITSVTLVIAERHLDRYGEKFISKVLTEYWSATSLAEQIF